MLVRSAAGSQHRKAARLGIAQPYLSQVLAGLRTPSPELIKKIVDVFGRPAPTEDQPISTEREPRRPTPPPPADPAAPPLDARVEASVLEVQRMIAAGRPPGDVYAVVQGVIAGSLGVGLTPDMHRGWTTLLKSLKEAAAERGRFPALHDHPGYLAESEAHLDDLEGVLRKRFGAAAAGEVLGELAVLQRAREAPALGARAA